MLRYAACYSDRKMPYPCSYGGKYAEAGIRENTGFCALPEMIKRYKSVPVFILAIVFLLVSEAFPAVDTGTIRGRIIDGFGKPVPRVSVNILSHGSRLKTTSDLQGTFSIEYTTESTKLIFDKEGYIPLNIPLLFKETVDLSAGDIILWERPPKGGLFVVEDNTYTEINTVQYYSESDKKEKRFYVKGSPTIIKGQEFRIVDFQEDNPLVTGKTLYRVDPDGFVGRIVFSPSQHYIFEKKPDNYTKIADNAGLRRLDLPPGRYFYCIGEMTIRSKTGFGFFFEIVNN